MRFVSIYIIIITVMILNSFVCIYVKEEEDRFINTEIEILYNGFSKISAINLTKFEISFGKLYKLARLKFKNKNCDLERLLEIFNNQIFKGSSQMPIDLRISVNLDIITNQNNLYDFQMEVPFKSMEMVSRMLKFNYETSIPVIGVSSAFIDRFPEFYCFVDSLPSDGKWFSLKISIGDQQLLKKRKLTHDGL